MILAFVIACGSSELLDSEPFLRLPTETPGQIVGLRSGFDHTCALNDQGRVYCWGTNDAGQLGDATTAPREHPRIVPLLEDVTEISLGGAFSCAITRGAAVCWGSNARGQLGDGTHDARSAPTSAAGELQTVGDRKDVVHIAASSSHACYITQDGEAYCWGGQQGGLHTEDRVEPTRVGDLTGLTVVASGPGVSCAGNAEGKVWCWNIDEAAAGQRGWGKPKRVTEVTHAGFLRANRHYSCATQTNGTVKCWPGADAVSLGADPKDRFVIGGLEGVTALVGDWAGTEKGEICLLKPTSERHEARPPVEGVFFEKVFGEGCFVDDESKVVCWGGRFPMEPVTWW